MNCHKHTLISLGLLKLESVDYKLKGQKFVLNLFPILIDLTPPCKVEVSSQEKKQRKFLRVLPKLQRPVPPSMAVFTMEDGVEECDLLY